MDKSAGNINITSVQINELLEQVKTEQVRLRKAEFELLQSQINPHFLYNTLDAIVWLAEAGEQKKVVSMVGSLSDFFRISLNQGQDILDVKEEVVKEAVLAAGLTLVEVTHQGEWVCVTARKD